jgi:mersacidin/lichenicidin family type 2 lantibiotic
MKSVDIIRAWKDEEYRLSLSAAQQASLPQNPAGMIELKEAELEAVTGGAAPVKWSEHGSQCGTSQFCDSKDKRCPLHSVFIVIFCAKGGAGTTAATARPRPR